jgi:hypothetical protein
VCASPVLVLEPILLPPLAEPVLVLVWVEPVLVLAVSPVPQARERPCRSPATSPA